MTASERLSTFLSSGALITIIIFHWLAVGQRATLAQTPRSCSIIFGSGILKQISVLIL